VFVNTLLGQLSEYKYLLTRVTWPT